MEWFPGGTPSRQLLDAGDRRPAGLPDQPGRPRRLGQLPAALDRAGPDRSSPRIRRTAGSSGSPTARRRALCTRARRSWWDGSCPAPTPAEQLHGLLLAQRHLHALGVTAWQDAIVGEYLGFPDPLPAYLAAARDGTLTARVEGALWWDRRRGGEQLDDLLARRQGGQVGRFRAGTVKIMQDGVAENFTAGMIEPYLDASGGQTGNSGLSYLDPADLAEQVTRLDVAGFGVHVHAIGDRAVREALDAFEAARASNVVSPGRHHIAHIQVVHGDDIPRFAELSVTANMQALWAAHEPQMDELTIPFLGPQRAARQYPFGALLQAGARLAAGSDWAVSSANPLWGIHVAVNRVLPPGQGDPTARAAAAQPGAEPGRGDGRVHGRLGVCEQPGRDRRHRAWLRG